MTKTNSVRAATLALLLSLGAAASILCCANSASADPLTWTLNNVNFDDGGTAVGTFDYDADTNTYSRFSITVAGGDTTRFPPFTYSPATSFLGGSFTGGSPFPVDASHLSLSSNTSVIVPVRTSDGGVQMFEDRRHILFEFSISPSISGEDNILQPLTNAGGSIPIATESNFFLATESNVFPSAVPVMPGNDDNFPLRTLLHTGPTVSTVPEPASCVLLFTGLANLGLIRIRTRRKQRRNPAGV